MEEATARASTGSAWQPAKTAVTSNCQHSLAGPPKDIPHDSLIAVMHDWEAALGGDCDFCHAAANANPGRLDFASDENRHKDIAGYMLRMTDSIKRQFFARWDAAREGHPAVGCYTCHHDLSSRPQGAGGDGA